MKLSVSLLVMLLDDTSPVAILQKRGEYNYEERRLETYSGAGQATCHGDLTEDETIEAGMQREVNEELGLVFGNIFFAHKEQRRIEMLGNQTGHNRTSVIFLMRATAEEIQKIRLGPSSGGLVRVEAEDVPRIRQLTPEMKNGVGKYAGQLFMFPDDIRALEVGFALVGSVVD
jgi:hypothetical protein